MNVNLPTDFERQDCISCGVVFFIPSVLGNNLRDSKNNFYCPNGHPQCYAKSRAEKLQEQLDQEKRRFEALQVSLSNAREESDHLKKDLAICLSKNRRAKKKKAAK